MIHISRRPQTSISFRLPPFYFSTATVRPSFTKTPKNPRTKASNTKSHMPPREQPASYIPHSKLQFFLPSQTSLCTPMGKSLLCTVDTCSSRSFITSSTLNSYFPNLQTHSCHPPIKTIKDNKPTMFISLPFSLIDSAGEKVYFKTNVQIMDGIWADRDRRVLLGVDFLDAKGLSKVRDREDRVRYLVGAGLRGRRIPLARVGDGEERRTGLRYNGKVACASRARPDRGCN